MGALLGLSSRSSSGISRLAIALAIVTIAAGEAIAFPTLPARETFAPSVLLHVRQDCSVETQGNKRITNYCEDGYLCSGPKTCRAGPEKQRELEEAQRKLEEEIRAVRGTERALAGNLTGQNPYAQGRASGCESTISMPGDAPRTCIPGTSGLSENVYNLSGGFPRVYNRPPPVRQPRRSSTSIRQNLRFAIAIAPLVEALDRFQPSDPNRRVIEQQIDRLAQMAKTQGIDADVALGGLNYKKGGTGSPPPTATPPTATPAPASPTPSVPKPAPTGVEAPTASETPSAPSVSSKDEALCEYLLTLEPSKPGSLPVEVPDYCKPYLQSIGRSTAPKPDPRYMRMTSEDAEEIRQMIKEVEDLELMPPGMVE